MGVSGLGGRDTCMYNSSLLASVSKHSTNATLSWSRLDSGEEKFGLKINHTGLLMFTFVSTVAIQHKAQTLGEKLTSMIQILLNPSLCAEEIVFSSPS